MAGDRRLLCSRGQGGQPDRLSTFKPNRTAWILAEKRPRGNKEIDISSGWANHLRHVENHHLGGGSGSAGGAGVRPIDDLRGLAGLKLDKATITSAQMVPEGPAPARGGGRGRRDGQRAELPPPPPPPRDDSGALPRAARAQALVRFADQHGALAPARGQVEREVHGRRQRRLRRIDSGSDQRDAAGAAARLRDRRHRHRSSGRRAASGRSAIPRR